MKFILKQEGKFKYIEEGKGMTIILLHGLMGGLSNFNAVIKCTMFANVAIDKKWRRKMEEDTGFKPAVRLQNVSKLMFKG